MFQRLPGREVQLTTRLAPTPAQPRQGVTVQRYLPTKGRRMVGAWCFLDHFGPDDVTAGEGMLVGPHPHTGLQTVTWLLDGEVLHVDSLGTRQTIVPGQLNLMTAGQGISHAEESPPDRPPRLHGLQLWVALPDGARHQQPAFEHHEQLPLLRLPGITAQVLMGNLAGVSSPATTHTPLVGAVLDVHEGAGADATAWLPMKRPFEYAVLLLDGEVTLDDEPLARDELVYLGHGREGARGALRPGRAGAAPRRRAVRRGDRHLVEPDRPRPRRGGVGAGAVERARPALRPGRAAPPAAGSRRRRCRPAGSGRAGRT